MVSLYILRLPFFLRLKVILQKLDLSLETYLTRLDQSTDS